MGLFLQFVLFILTCFFTFTFPGIYFLSLTKIKLTRLECVFVGSVLGFVVFTLIAYFLIVINLLSLIIPLYILVNLLIIKKVLKVFRKKVNYSLKTSVVLLLVFFIGILGQLLIIAPSGAVINGEIVFWSAHGFDGTWHLALIEEIKRGWPFQNPIMAGEKLVNYHYFSDIAPAVFAKYLGISNLDLYFRFFPFVYSLFLGTSVYFFVKRLTKNISASIWAVIFTYFAGSWGYIVTLIKDRKIGGESIFWGTQIQSASGNPPQIISDFLVITYIYLINTLLQKKNRYLFVFAVLVVSSLAMFKVYAAFVLLGATGILGIWKLIRSKELYLLSFTISSVVLSAILYIPNVSISTSFLIFQPWWFVRTMIVEPSRLDWIDLELRRQTYIYENNFKRVIFIEFQGFIIFLFGNLGMRFLGFWEFLLMFKATLSNNFYLLFVLVIIISFVMPLLFLQKGVAGNTAQFLQYFLLLFGILAGMGTAKLISNIKYFPLKYLLAGVIILLALPTQLGLIHELYSRGPFAKISKEEVHALSFMKQNLKGTILTPMVTDEIFLGDIEQNIWDWEDTAYVSAFSGNRTYFDAKEQADIMGYNFKAREELKTTLFKTIHSDVFTEKLVESGADFLYFPKVLRPKSSPELSGINKIYENEKVEIWDLSSLPDKP